MADQPLQVVFLDRDTISPQTSLRQLSFEHTLTVYGRTSRDQVAERIADADIVITNKVALRQEALEQAGRLKIVAVAATSTENHHLATHARPGLTVTNSRGSAVPPLPRQHSAMISCLLHHIPSLH